MHGQLREFHPHAAPLPHLSCKLWEPRVGRVTLLWLERHSMPNRTAMVNGYLHSSLGARASLAGDFLLVKGFCTHAPCSPYLHFDLACSLRQVSSDEPVSSSWGGDVHKGAVLQGDAQSHGQVVGWADSRV